jgi:hypothetical protein
VLLDETLWGRPAPPPPARPASTFLDVMEQCRALPPAALDVVLQRWSFDQMDPAARQALYRDRQEGDRKIQQARTEAENRRRVCPAPRVAR